MLCTIFIYLAFNDVRRFRWTTFPDFATSRWVERDYVDGEWTDRRGEGECFKSVPLHSFHARILLTTFDL